MKKSKIDNLIQEYLLEEGILREKLPDPNSELDFGFIFSYPPGPKGLSMNVLKPKNKSFIIVAIRRQIPESHIKALNSQKNNKTLQFFTDIRKYFLIKEVFFQIDINNYRYEINDQLYLTKDGFISKDSFFKGIRRIYYCFTFSNLILKEYCSGKEIASKEFSADFDLPLYS